MRMEGDGRGVGLSRSTGARSGYGLGRRSDYWEDLDHRCMLKGLMLNIHVVQSKRLRGGTVDIALKNSPPIR